MFDSFDENTQKSNLKIGGLCAVKSPHADNAGINAGGLKSDIRGIFDDLTLSHDNFPLQHGDVVILVAIRDIIHHDGVEERLVIFSPAHKCLGWVWREEIESLQE